MSITRYPDVDVDRDAQQDLAETITVRWTGKLRDRVQQRMAGYVLKGVDSREVDPSLFEDDADRVDKCQLLAHRALGRQKTNVVCETVEEVRALYQVLDYYSYATGPMAVSWVNGPMAKAAWRVRQDLDSALEQRTMKID